MTTTSERAMSWILTIAAVVIAGTLVRREFVDGSQARVTETRRAMEFDSTWTTFATKGVFNGRVGAPIVLTEFADLECPACREFQKTITAVREKYGDRVALTFVHVPLPSHRFSRMAAQAAQCAGSQGRFKEFIAVIYEKQDSLGLLPWSALATEAGLPDTARYSACVASKSPDPLIEQGFQLARRISLTGTPTLFANGWRFTRVPTVDEVSAVVDSLLVGKKPTAE